MWTTTLSSVITGWGGKATTCSRRSISGLSRSTNGITIARPGVERAAVAPEALDDAGTGLRDDADRPRRHEQGEEDEHGEDDQTGHGWTSYSATSAVAPRISTTRTCRPGSMTSSSR